MSGEAPPRPPHPPSRKFAPGWSSQLPVNDPPPTPAASLSVGTGEPVRLVSGKVAQSQTLKMAVASKPPMLTLPG